jgi:hypothetical protein
MRLHGLLFAFGLCAAAALSGPAGAQPAGPAPHARQSCISPEFIDGISATDTRTAYLSVGPSDMYRLDMMGPCMNLDWPMTPKKLINKMGSGDICDGHDMVLIVGEHQRCYVSSMHKMSPAEIAAWRKSKH